MNNEIISFLLNCDPLTEYKTRTDLLNDNSEKTIIAYKKMISHPHIDSLLNELSNWPGTVLNSHKSAGHLIHKLSFIADTGISLSEPRISEIIKKITENISDEGPFQVLMNIPTHFGGSGNDELAWALCDAPILIYSLTKLGLIADERVIKAKNYLLNFSKENGFPCVVSKELGKFRGPGKKSDSCPYATLLMLKVISQFEDEKDSDIAENSIESLLNQWQDSKEKHPYMFLMGTDFRKLKAPFIWFDIMHLVEVLSHFSCAVSDERFKDMVSLIQMKADINGLYTPESEWKAWNGWSFGQKKTPSAWLSFLVYRLLNRLKTNY